MGLPEQIQTAGELNYVITRIIREYAARQGFCYDTLNAVMGVLGSISAEFYRRVISLYEDRKKGENGDVF